MHSSRLQNPVFSTVLPSDTVCLAGVSESRQWSVPSKGPEWYGTWIQKQPLQLRRGRGLHSPAPAIATALLCSFCGCGRWRCLKTGIRLVLWRCQPPLRYPAQFESKEIQAQDMPGRDPWSSGSLCLIASDSRRDFLDLPPFACFALLDTQWFYAPD